MRKVLKLAWKGSLGNKAPEPSTIEDPRAEGTMPVKYFEAETLSHWCGVEKTGIQ
ncbi:hypothetical protein TNCV_1205731 [Trichonephila clavipes]|nr:hypothetical protein TNCV_1205731 [Trichonephila clavipes]